MRTDVLGRVKNINLPASKPLFPLFEAIINSIHAIEDTGESKGQIDIKIIRETSGLFSKQDSFTNDILGFEIIDNGIGFNEENFLSFETSDTTFKAKKGGKGIGRFLWLVAFDKADIESHYFENGRLKCRRFTFISDREGVTDIKIQDSQEGKCLTKVSLTGFKEKYLKFCPKKPDTIAYYIVEHCVAYFLQPDCPTIYLHDNVSSEIINLNDVFTKEINANSNLESYEIKSQKFLIRHIKLYSSHATEHSLHFYAHARVVKSEKLIGKIPGLIKRLQDPDLRDFVYAGYVESDILNDCVTSERMDFNIAEEASKLFPDDIAWNDIKNISIEQCSTFLKPYTEPIMQKVKERINTFVESEGPMYRPILKHIKDKINVHDPEIKSSDLDLKFYEAYQSLQLQTKVTGQKLLQEIESDVNFEDYTNKLKEYFDIVNDLNSSDLARYVCHRRAVLDFLYKQLTIQDFGKYKTENRIHDIIFPRGKTSAEVEFDKHNLWLIDEKLAYHKFLASDKQLRTMAPLETRSQKEPDIIVFDKACAFSPSKELTFPTITIIEFKKPMRDDYTKDNNPFTQVVEYIEAIKAGKARTMDGRNVPFQQGIHFFCYIVCDMAQSLEKQAKFFGLDKTADGQGFFGYQKNYDAYFEVISYSKMVTDAKMRNAVLFDKLNLPTTIS